MLKRLMQTLTIILPLTLSPLAMGADFSKGHDAYEKGDYKTALSHVKPLAEQGAADAQYFLGLMYDNGQGIPQDDKKAVYWYTKAVEQGNAYAQKNLGIKYAMGEGVPQDYKLAYMWLNIARYNGASNAQGMVIWMNTIAPFMSQADINQAQEMSSRCLASGYKNCGY